jgi:hypothetical protein
VWCCGDWKYKAPPQFAANIWSEVTTCAKAELLVYITTMSTWKRKISPNR